MPVDLTVFDKQKSIIDQQQLQDAFELKKALAINEAQRSQQRADREQQLLNYKMQETSKGATAPSAVQTYEYVQKLSPEQQKLFFQTLRGDTVKDVGSGYAVYDPVNRKMTSVYGGAKELTPAQQDAAFRKNIDAQEQFNRGVEVKEKALQTVYRLIGNQSAAPGTLEHEGNIAGVKANRGRVSALFPNVFSGAIDAEADLNYLTNLLTTENLGLLKGVLSDTDMQILKNIGSGDLMGSDEKSIAALQRLRDVLSKKVEAGRAIQSQGFGNLPPPPLSSLDLPPAPGATPPAVGAGGNINGKQRLKYNPATGNFE